MPNLHCPVNRFTTFLTRGITASEVGKDTAKPMRKLAIHTGKNSGIKPTFMMVMARDIVKDKAIDIKAPKSTVAYFLFILTTINLA